MSDININLHLRSHTIRPFRPPRWRRGKAFASHAVDRGSIPGRERPNSLKQVVIAPLPNARQQVLVSRVLGDENYKELARSRTRPRCSMAVSDEYR